MLPQPHTAVLVTQVKNNLGQITSSTEEDFDCLVQQSTQYDYIGGQVAAIGKGVVFTSEESLNFVVGMPLLIEGASSMIKKATKCCDENGEFSHWELIYV